MDSAVADSVVPRGLSAASLSSGAEMMGVVQLISVIEFPVLVLVNDRREFEPGIAGSGRRDYVSALIAASAIVTAFVFAAIVTVSGIIPASRTISASVTAGLFLSVPSDRPGQQRLLLLAGSQHRQCQEYAHIFFHAHSHFPKVTALRGIMQMPDIFPIFDICDALADIQTKYIPLQ